MRNRTVDSSLAAIVSGTIVAAAIINEIVAVIIAKYAFKGQEKSDKERVPGTIGSVKPFEYMDNCPVV